MENSRGAIAVVGMACRYADAATPAELWETVLARRRAFRRIPPERLRLEDYLGESNDSVYLTEAALLEGWELDRVRFRVSGPTFRTTDAAHWLALDVTADALADADFPDGGGLPADTTGVILGNTLTGEESRAHSLRLRWPYVRRQVAAELAAEGLADERLRRLLARLEERYKNPFPEPNDESLAGGLANTIAGRIANHFDLHGGGFIVDGACSSSLLAVIQAATALAAGDLDVAVAGGVDLSLDPFELVGFARTGALARGAMRVYDRRSDGFLPGEGCGVVVLMRLDEALAAGRPVHAVIRGWGLSSDGNGGLTRPKVEGQLLALRRAYRRAGFGIDTLGLVEGHGTGTRVGDAVELRTLNQARRDAGAESRAALGSIKANIGHTKAAAGVAGLIKAALALENRVVPPTTGCEEPHDELAGAASTLRVLDEPESWPRETPLRASVSAMGFGGINSHLVLEGTTEGRRSRAAAVAPQFRTAPQDAELFLVAAPDRAALEDRLGRLAQLVERMSRAELGDCAAELARRIEASPDGPPPGPWRAALVADHPRQLWDRLEILRGRIADGSASLDPVQGVFLARGTESSPLDPPGGTQRPCIGLLFPGQGSPTNGGGGLWRRRFANTGRLWDDVDRPLEAESATVTDTATAQPAIAAASLAALMVLERWGIKADVALGHSLGELVALHWAGACDAEVLLHIVRERGRAMSELGADDGAMAALGAGAEDVAVLLAELNGNGSEIRVAAYNAPRRTVIAGPRSAVDAVLVRAEARGWQARHLKVSHAFHSPLVAAAEPRFAAVLEAEHLASPRRRVSSTITGGWLPEDADLSTLLRHQITSPVRFLDAFRTAAPEVDLFLEAGPGRTLSTLANEIGGAPPAIALDAGGDSLRGLLSAAGALFALGAPLDAGALFDDRFTRPFDLEHEFRFLANPCELAPIDPDSVPAVETRLDEAAEEASGAPDGTPLDVVRQLLVRRTELPAAAIDEESRLLSDLHLSSIAVGELVIDATRELGLPRSAAPTEYADATVSDLALALAELVAAEETGGVREGAPEGLDAWVRPFVVREVERPQRRGRRATESDQSRQVMASSGAVSSLAAALEASPGGEVVALLSGSGDQAEVLLRAARTSLTEHRPFVVVEHDGADPAAGGAAFARALHLEAPSIPVTVLRLPPIPETDAAAWAQRVGAEAEATDGFSAVRYDNDGRRFESFLELLPEALDSPPSSMPSLDPGDVVLVSGGGKGIGAECALALARNAGIRLVVFGRSRPASDPELAANLERFTAHGVEHRYIPVDLGDGDAVRVAIARAEAELGPVRALLHCAGVNTPKLIRDLTPGDVAATWSPKVAGFEHLLAAVDRAALKLVVGFGSILARLGLAGEADYALANEALRHRLEAFAAAHPACRTLCLEWSVWSAVGMGDRLGTVEKLAQQGVTAIAPDAGVEHFLALLRRATPVSVVVTGRFGTPPTIQVGDPETAAAGLPLLRFLETPRVHVPGVELVVDADVSSDNDPYLADHVFEGERLLPAVLGLEAMAQIWRGLTGCTGTPSFRRIRFERPVTVPAGETVTLRLLALAHPSGEVEVALRSDRTAFGVDHFHAWCVPAQSPGQRPSAELAEMPDNGPLAVDPEELYGSVLFQSGRFRRLRGYRRLRATECLAEVDAELDTPWFGSYQSPELILGDPGARDAALHAIQACIPHATVLPRAAEAVWVGDGASGATASAGPRRVAARERERRGRTLVYDLEVSMANGELIERWEGLELRIVHEHATVPALPAPLWGPYLERRLGDLLPDTSLAVAVTRNGHPNRRQRGERAVALARGESSRILRRPDGKPETVNGHAISIAHCVFPPHSPRGGPSDDLALAVVGRAAARLGCDIEPVAPRPRSTWSELLGSRAELLDLLARDSGEDHDALATRLWTVLESLKKVGRGADAPLVHTSTTTDGWMLFASGRHVAGTVLLPLGDGTRASVAILTEIG